MQKISLISLALSLICGAAQAANVPLSSFGAGGTFSNSTDKVVTVRNGGGPANPDVLTTLACASLSNAAASCATDTTNASNISTGTLSASRGGIGAVSGIVRGNGAGVASAAVAGTDYQAPVTLTTTGTSGAATFVANTLNIPNYATGGGSAYATAMASETGLMVGGLQ